METTYKGLKRNGILNALTLIIVFSLLFQVTSCKKYLDEKPSKNLVVPSTVADLQALLNNNSSINNGMTPRLLALVSDDNYVTTTTWLSESSIETTEPLNYIWDKNATDLVGSWEAAYDGPIYYSNIVLDALPNIASNNGNLSTLNAIKGSALFYRAFAFQALAQLYCKPYNTTSKADPGIVLKLTSDINEKIVRATVQQTYDQIINDLNQAVTLLPSKSTFPTQPTVGAVYGLLARVYLSMRDYSNAGKYANLSLQQNSALMDFNSVISIPQFNVETTYFDMVYESILAYPSHGGLVDSNLYRSYDSNDLRKSVFFKAASGGAFAFRGSYYGFRLGLPFDGIATDEMYLTRAECYARAGDVADAMADLNTLLKTRWKTGTFVPFAATNADDAKSQILTERRKELVYRGLRWYDLRRLNLEGANITLTRVINGTTYTLPPNDLRYVMLIPFEVINASGIQQNPR